MYPFIKTTPAKHVELCHKSSYMYVEWIYNEKVDYCPFTFTIKYRGIGPFPQLCCCFPPDH